MDALARGRWPIAAVVALLAVLGGGWLWLRDSSLVSVQHVNVVGVTGADAQQIHSSLVAAAHGMTTMDVRVGTLRSAVSSYPVVKGLRVRTQFPHGMTIYVTEQIPVAVAMVGGQSVPVASDGTLLRDGSGGAQLPVIALSVFPGGTRLVDPAALAELRLLAAAPYQLLSRLGSVSNDPAHGITAVLRQGPRIYFGDAGRVNAKWQSAVAVLATKQTAGAAYVDVSDPERAAAGANLGVAAGSGSAAGTSSAAGSASTSTGG